MIKVKKLRSTAIMPSYAHAGDSGFDLYAAEDTYIPPHQTAVVPTGLAFGIPEGYELQIRPRSGVTSKTKLRVQLGTIDQPYIGEVGIIVDNIGAMGQFIERGFKLAQAVKVSVEQDELREVDELSETDRGTNGFGSTDGEVNA